MSFIRNISPDEKSQSQESILEEVVIDVNENKEKENDINQYAHHEINERIVIVESVESILQKLENEYVEIDNPVIFNLNQEIQMEVIKFIELMDRKHDQSAGAFLQNKARETRRHRLNPSNFEQAKSQLAYVFSTINSVASGGGFALAIADGFGDAFPTVMMPFALGAVVYFAHSVFKNYKNNHEVIKVISKLNNKIIYSLEELTRKKGKTQSKLDRLIIQIKEQTNLLTTNGDHANLLINKICFQLIFLTIILKYAEVLDEVQKNSTHVSLHHTAQQNFTKYLNKLNQGRNEIVKQLLEFSQKRQLSLKSVEELYEESFAQFAQIHRIDAPEYGLLGVPGDIFHGLVNFKYNVDKIIRKSLSSLTYLIENTSAAAANCIAFFNTQYNPSANTRDFFNQIDSFINSVNHSIQFNETIFHSTDRSESLLNMTQPITNLTNSNTTIIEPIFNLSNISEPAHGSRQFTENVNEIYMTQETFFEFTEATEGIKDQFYEEKKLLNLYQGIGASITIALSLMSIGLKFGVNKRKEKRQELIKTIEKAQSDIDAHLEDWENYSVHNQQKNLQFKAKIEQVHQEVKKVYVVVQEELENHEEKLASLMEELSIKKKLLEQKDNEIAKLRYDNKTLKNANKTLQGHDKLGKGLRRRNATVLNEGEPLRNESVFDDSSKIKLTFSRNISPDKYQKKTGHVNTQEPQQVVFGNKI